MLQQARVPYSSFTDIVALPDWTRVHCRCSVHDITHEGRGYPHLVRVRDERGGFIDLRIPEDCWPEDMPLNVQLHIYGAVVSRKFSNVNVDKCTVIMMDPENVTPSPARVTAVQWPRMA